MRQSVFYFTGRNQKFHSILWTLSALANSRKRYEMSISSMLAQFNVLSKALKARGPALSECRSTVNIMLDVVETSRLYETLHFSSDDWEPIIYLSADLSLRTQNLSLKLSKNNVRYHLSHWRRDRSMQMTEVRCQGIRAGNLVVLISRWQKSSSRRSTLGQPFEQILESVLNTRLCGIIQEIVVYCWH